MGTSLKFQAVSGDNPTNHEIDQRVSTGKFDGDAQGDHHKTLFEVDEVTGTVGDFLKRVSGNQLSALTIPIIHKLTDLDLDQDALGFLLARGDEINKELTKIDYLGNSLRIALMDMQEQV